MRILIVFGTRPEAIKMCPVILEMRRYDEIECSVCLTGQHRDMLIQVMNSFGIVADYNLDIMSDGQTLVDITTGVINGMNRVFAETTPDLMLVHGDTTTAFAASIAAFYAGIPVGHVEAGLRTENIWSPFPEEMNRRVIDCLSSIFFAPTQLNRLNITKGGIKDNIYVTGNTVIDSFRYTVKENYVFMNSILNNIDYKKKCIVVTAHRRENIGQPLINICNAIRRIAIDYVDTIIVFPVHPNPLVKKTVTDLLDNINNVLLISPIDIFDMHNLLSMCYMVMTDSGGLQEEAPHFGKPVLVLRNETERPEAIEAGTAKLAGTKENDIYSLAIELIANNNKYEDMAKRSNPYGDGHASERIVHECMNFIMNKKL